MHIRHTRDKNGNCTVCGNHKHHKHYNNINIFTPPGCKYREIMYFTTCCLCDWEEMK